MTKRTIEEECRSYEDFVSDIRYKSEKNRDPKEFFVEVNYILEEEDYKRASGGDDPCKYDIKLGFVKKVTHGTRLNEVYLIRGVSLKNELDLGAWINETLSSISDSLSESRVRSEVIGQKLKVYSRMEDLFAKVGGNDEL